MEMILPHASTLPLVSLRKTIYNILTLFLLLLHLVCVENDLGTTPLNQTDSRCELLPSMASNRSMAVDNGIVCYNDTRVRSKATYHCDAGYTLSGSQERVCQCDGIWTGDIPMCVHVPTTTQESPKGTKCESVFDDVI